MPQYSTFSKWVNSPYYSLLHESNLVEKGKFINELLSRLKPPEETKILHTGCGTGTQSKAISASGFDVTGIDYSFEAINKAKNAENEKLRFFQHDIRLPFWINYFNYAFNLFTSFGYFNTFREHRNSIRTIAQSLLLNGSLVIDTFNSTYQENNVPNKQEKTVDDFHFCVTEWADTENYYIKTELEEQGITKELHTEKLLKYSLGDFSEMLAYHGLQIQEVYGDYAFTNYNITRSPRLILIAEKIRR